MAACHFRYEAPIETPEHILDRGLTFYVNEKTLFKGKIIKTDLPTVVEVAQETIVP